MNEQCMCEREAERDRQTDKGGKWGEVKRCLNKWRSSVRACTSERDRERDEVGGKLRDVGMNSGRRRGDPPYFQQSVAAIRPETREARRVGLLQFLHRCLWPARRVKTKPVRHETG